MSSTAVPSLWAPSARCASSAGADDDEEPPACTAEQLRMDECLVELHRHLPSGVLLRRARRGVADDCSQLSRDTVPRSLPDASTPVTFPLTATPRSSARPLTTPPGSTSGDEEEAAFLAALAAEDEAAEAEEAAFLAGLDSGDTGADDQADEEASFLRLLDRADEEEVVLRLRHVAQPERPAPAPQTEGRSVVLYEPHAPVRDTARLFSADADTAARKSASGGAAR